MDRLVTQALSSLLVSKPIYNYGSYQAPCVNHEYINMRSCISYSNTSPDSLFQVLVVVARCQLYGKPISRDGYEVRVEQPANVRAGQKLASAPRSLATDRADRCNTVPTQKVKNTVGQSGKVRLTITS